MWLTTCGGWLPALRNLDSVEILLRGFGPRFQDEVGRPGIERVTASNLAWLLDSNSSERTDLYHEEGIHPQICQTRRSLHGTKFSLFIDALILDTSIDTRWLRAGVLFSHDSLRIARLLIGRSLYSQRIVYHFLFSCVGICNRPVLRVLWLSKLEIQAPCW